MAPRRVVSLVPSLTETLFDLGAGDSVVGITDYCIFPADLDRPRVGGTKNPRIEDIRALAPDLVHMNFEENVRRHAEQIETFAKVHVTEPKNVDDVESLLLSLGELHDRSGRARELVQELRAARFTATPFTFAVPIWKQPWMWCGGDTYVSGLVESTGGRNVLRDDTRYPSRTVGEVVALRPDIIFLPDEPYVFTPEDAATIPGRVIGPFPGYLFTWHGTRTIQGLEFLRRSLSSQKGHRH